MERKTWRTTGQKFLLVSIQFSTRETADFSSTTEKSSSRKISEYIHVITTVSPWQHKHDNDELRKRKLRESTQFVCLEKLLFNTTRKFDKRRANGQGEFLRLQSPTSLLVTSKLPHVPLTVLRREAIHAEFTGYVHTIRTNQRRHTLAFARQTFLV